jgi:hypothetical protein
MKLIASHNQFLEHNFFAGVAIRDPGDFRWYSPGEREKRVLENPLFKDISSPKSPLNHTLKTIKDLYLKMNRAIAAYVLFTISVTLLVNHFSKFIEGGLTISTNMPQNDTLMKSRGEPPQ